MLSEVLNGVGAASEGVGIILPVGLAVFFGTIGARIFQKLHVPQIIGYISVGIILGPLLNVVSAQEVEALEPFNLFALGIIGFLIGGELKRDIFVKFGKQVAAILLLEGIAAFLLVGILSFLIMWYFSSWQTALAIGVVFGAICAATDPASTVNVLWEYKTRGPLTAMLTTVVALDDALALVLYITSVSIAGVLTGHQQAGLFTTMLYSLYEIAGSLALGAGAGLLLRWIVKRVDDDEKTLAFTIAVVVLAVGLAKRLGLDVILSAMALGVTLVNLSPRRSMRSFDILHRFSAPVYVLFFVIIGARLNVSHMSASTQIWLLAAAYIIGSIIGKTTGSYCGAVYSKAAPNIRRYLGFCLYPQGTIAIALLVMASHRFEGHIRDVMLSVIIVGVFVLQIIGPVFIKIGAKKAGEVGLNITEQDLIRAYTVRDVMEKEAPVISAGLSLSEVVKIVSTTDSFYYPVIDNDQKLIGAITLDGIRNTFATQELNDWLVALDIMEPIIAKATPDLELAEAFEVTRRFSTEFLPVVASRQDESFSGVLSVHAAHRQLSAEVLAKQRKADSMYGLGEAVGN